MADTKTANLSRLVLKQAGRAKEKILQNLGKSDKTTDEIFEEHLANFNAQQVNATRLHKDINNYLRCIRVASLLSMLSSLFREDSLEIIPVAMQTASKNLMDTLSDIYEKEWIGQDMLHVQAQNNEMLWADLAHKLTDQVVTPLNTYQAQFPEMRKKIDKRGRKLIDYDAERHNVQTMQNNPNRNEAKYIRAKEQMENAKRTYEVLNSELHDELPALFDSRVIFLVTNMQTLFAAEEVFHSETSKVFSELETVVDKLSKEVQKGTLPRRSMSRALPLEHSSPPVINNSMNSPPKAKSTILSPNSLKKVQSFSSDLLSHVRNYYQTAKTNVTGGRQSVSTPHLPDRLEPAPDASFDDEFGIESPVVNGGGALKPRPRHNGDLDSDEPVMTNGHGKTKKPTTNGSGSKYRGHSPTKDYEVVGHDRTTGGYDRFNKPDRDDNDRGGHHRIEENGNGRMLSRQEIPPGASTDNMPPGVLYKVKAAYKYQAEDVDELSFEVGEVVQVIEYEDPEEQEEGWLMGIKESTGQKGLFPANFTRPM